MGLINTSHAEMTQSLIDLQDNLLSNPFYLFNDKKGIPVTYYNLNTTRSTLDQGLKIAYSEIGPDCPLRWNKVTDFYIYGLDRIAINLDNGEFGIESNEISGDAFILPDTLKPYPGDYFSINMIKKKVLFKVVSVTNDTFDNGGNYWKIEYSLTYNDASRLEPLIVEEFSFVSGNIGTNYASVMKKTKFDVAKQLDDAAVALKNYYRGLFYNEKVQTFTCTHTYTNINAIANYIYDPYLIEFIIDNKVLANSGASYEYIDHKTKLKGIFPIKYDKSIWRVLETHEKSEITSCYISANPVYIDDPGTIFNTRIENYFELNYGDGDIVSIFDPQVIGHIENNQLFDQSTRYAKYNIIIKYFNNTDIGIEDLLPLERIVVCDNTQENYFLLPMVIFVMEYYIKDLMKNTSE